MNPPNHTPSAQPSVMAMKAADAIDATLKVDDFGYFGGFATCDDMARIIDQSYAPYVAAVEEARQAWENYKLRAGWERLDVAMSTLARLHAEQQGKQEETK